MKKTMEKILFFFFLLHYMGKAALKSRKHSWCIQFSWGEYVFLATGICAVSLYC